MIYFLSRTSITKSASNSLYCAIEKKSPFSTTLPNKPLPPKGKISLMRVFLDKASSLMRVFLDKAKNLLASRFMEIVKSTVSILFAIFCLYWGSEIFVQILQFDANLSLTCLERYHSLTIDYEMVRFLEELQGIIDSHSDGAELLKNKVSECIDSHRKILSTINQTFDGIPKNRK